MRAAKEWRDAKTKTERKGLYKTNGVRWSVLLELPYWDPTKSIVVDSMHNLFLGLVRFHFRHIICVDTSPGRHDVDDDPPVSEKAMKKARKLFRSGPTRKKLRRLTVPILKTLCEEIQVSIPDGGRIRKDDIISALLVRNGCIAEHHTDALAVVTPH
jgi:hypothetical protein